MEKVFSSFLGTSRYKETTYMLYGRKVKTKYIQSALVQIINGELWKETENRKIFRVFLTPKAEKENWPYLKQEIESLQIGIEIEPVLIEKDIIASENELWELFEKVADSFNENESVIFDITHGFRFYPMMILTVLNYLKIVKNINIEGIFYGAWEAKNENGVAPVLELTGLNNFFDWMVGVQNFIKYGISENLVELLKIEVDNINRVAKGKNEDAEYIKKFYNNLKIFTESIRTCRGKEIISGFSKEKFKCMCEKQKDITKPESIDYQLLQNFSKKIGLREGKFSRLLKTILEKVQDNLSPFSSGNIENLFYAAKWCAAHGLFQQGYTFLREYVSSYYVKEKFGFDKIFCISTRKKVEEELMNDRKSILYRIGKSRNDINHCGMREETLKRKDLKKQLDRWILEVEKELINKK